MTDELFSPDEVPPVPRRRGRPRGVHPRIREPRIANVARQPGKPLDALQMGQMKRRIVDGLVHKTLDAILRENPDLPGRRMFARWMMEDTGFSRECGIARQEHAQGLLELIQAELLTAKDRNEAYAAQVKAQHMQWYVSKILPQIYGDRLEIDHKVERVILPPNPQDLPELKEPTIAGLIEASTILPGTARPEIQGPRDQGN